MHVAIGILQCIDINEFTIDREKERRIRCIMIDETIIAVNKRYWLWVAYI